MGSFYTGGNGVITNFGTVNVTGSGSVNIDPGTNFVNEIGGTIQIHGANRSLEDAGNLENLGLISINSGFDCFFNVPYTLANFTNYGTMTANTTSPDRSSLSLTLLHL